jgi:hypothetical protein
MRVHIEEARAARCCLKDRSLVAFAGIVGAGADRCDLSVLDDYRLIRSDGSGFRIDDPYRL